MLHLDISGKTLFIMDMMHYINEFGETVSSNANGVSNNGIGINKSPHDGNVHHMQPNVGSIDVGMHNQLGRMGDGNNGVHGGDDDDALSSLLLLLKSNQSKQERALAATEISSTNSNNINNSYNVGGSLGGIGDKGSSTTHSNRNSNSAVAKSNATSTTANTNSSGKTNNSGSGTTTSRPANVLYVCTLEELRKYFHLPIAEVARQLGICTTLLKKVCRKNKILRWPYRQIKSITKSIQSLEVASLNESLSDRERSKYKDQIILLHDTLNLLIQDPNAPVQDIIGSIDMGGGSVGEDEESADNLRDKTLPVGDPGGAEENGNDGSGDSAVKLPHSTADVAATSTDVAIGKFSSSRPIPNTQVAAVIAAAVATADIEVRTESTQRKRRAAQIASAIKEEEERVARAKANLFAIEENTNNSDNGIFGNSSYSSDHVESHDAQPVQSRVVGSTIVNFILVTQCGHRKLQFRAPVHLAPLERKKIRVSKRVVPLIEPDICNNMKMDFLCSTIVREGCHSFNGSKLPSELSHEDVMMKLNQIEGLHVPEMDESGAQHESSEINDAEQASHGYGANAAEIDQNGNYNAHPQNVMYESQSRESGPNELTQASSPNMNISGENDVGLHGENTDENSLQRANLQQLQANQQLQAHQQQQQLIMAHQQQQYEAQQQQMLDAQQHYQAH